MFLFRGGRPEDVPYTDEEMKDHMHKWGAWMELMTNKNQMKSGQPLDFGGKVVYKTDDGSFKSDGPFPEAKEMIGGYIIIQANNMDEAVEISKGCPIYENGGVVEIRELISLPM